MRSFYLLCVVFAFLILAEPIKAKQITYVTGTFSDILEQSQVLDKPFFAVFCKNKKGAKQNKIADPIMQDFIDQHYIAVKVNVRDKIGKRWKKDFSVDEFPTVIVFDKDGTISKRYNFKIPESTLMDALVKTIQEADVIEETEPLFTEVEEEKEILFISKKELLSNALFEVTVPLDPTEKNSKTGANISNVAVSSDEMINPKSINSHPAMMNESVKNSIGANREENVVQVGRFDAYSESLVLLKKLRRQYQHSIYVIPETRNGGVIYRVMVGDFSTEDEALTFLDEVAASE